MTTLAYLLADTPRVGPLVTPRSPGCTGAAWASLLRDGYLVEVRDGYALVAGVAESAGLRACTFAQEVTGGLVLARSWAAWVHTGGPPPRGRTCVVYRPGTSRPKARAWLDAVQAPLRPWDVTELGGVALTTPVRTAMDLATWSTEDDARRALLRLAAAGTDLGEAALQLDRTAGWRGSAVARRRIDEARRAAGTQAWTTGSAAFEPVMR
ncbi:hypothetical protein Sked_17590 [Sanguibacter keddieii DSM 10542]|uniref:AbiEi antitoxin C-terminal domain-containing protein n=1 Tax=Sanguibacter keddieii (strain ATCC 51767 / DSM 10542 / NCFB 3025 / ST-74) TaxID=446469 RepID=D1BGW6_SANKS|nr:hypothetical protein [Sanguibacter keddieii]ACZ21686.1 hypothetical protein Sked_17590 [Sanguibacter keddieii DSM 10542]